MNRKTKGKLLLGTAASVLVFLTGCQTNNISEAQRFEASVRKEMPFRIDIREGRPQKYGTQSGPDGLCPLLDASRVNEWRKEVGLPPIEIK